MYDCTGKKKNKKKQVDIFTENYSDCENLEYILSSSNSKLKKSSNLIQDLITYCVTKDAATKHYDF